MAKELLARRLAEFVTDVSYQNLPEQVVEKMRLILLHNIGVALAGRPTNAVAKAVTLSAGTVGPASLLTEKSRAQPGDAAFFNSVLIHGRAQDDVYMKASSHLGCTVLPAALAVAEVEGRSGAELIAGLVAGYEVAASVAKSSSQEVTRRGFRATGLYGVIGAAAAAARLMDLNTDQVANAIAIATSFSAGLNQTWIDGSEEWRFQVGQCARNGILAASLARAGGTGAREAFEGKAGFLAAFTGRLDLVAETGLELGHTWETLCVTFKPHPVCACNQTPVELLLRMLRAHPVQPADVAKLDLYMSPFEAIYPGINESGPFCDVGATLMSAQYCLAAALSFGEVRLKHLYRFSDPTLSSLWPRIRIYPDESLGLNSCRIELITTSGLTLQDKFTANSNTFNWSRTEVAALVRSLQPEMDINPKQLEDLIGAILDVNQLASLEPLLTLTVADNC